MKIKQAPELMDLYRLIYEWPEDVLVAFNSPPYEGKGYLPHRTFQKSGSLFVGKKESYNQSRSSTSFQTAMATSARFFKTIEL